MIKQINKLGMNVLRILFILLIIFLINCGGDGNDENTTENENISPIASIDFPLNNAKFFIDETINFQGSSSVSDGTIISYNWDFGDQTTNPNQNPSHSYSNEGTYTVKLTVTDNNEATATDTITLYIEPNIALSGTWNMSRTETGSEDGDNTRYEETTIFIQDGNTIVMNSCREYGSDGVVLTLSDNTINADYDNFVLNGSFNNDYSEITGTYNIGDLAGTITFTKISNSTEYLSKGSLVIQGEYCEQTINIDSNNICIEKDYKENEDNFYDIEINTSYNDGEIGLDIESAYLFSSNTTFDIQNDNFEIVFQGDIVLNCNDYGDEGEQASSGTVTIEIYNDTQLKGSFDLNFQDGSNLTGSFDIEI